MKIKSGVVTGLIALLVIFAAVAYAGGQQNSMQDQQMDQQGAMMQDPETVKQVQQALSDQGYDPGPVDGKWKPQTENALKDFQQAQGIQATGQLDQQTLASLGVEGGAAAGGREGDMTEEQPAMPPDQGAMPPDQSGAGGQQGGSKY